MATARTWYDDANIDITYETSQLYTAKKVLWMLKAVLKGDERGDHGASGAAPSEAIWTCAGSGDGEGGAGMDATDRWVTPDAIKFNNPGPSGHSWIVLQSPVDIGGVSNGTYQLLIDCGSDAYETVGLYLSKTGFTGGSLTARPTATDEVTINDNTGYFVHDISVSLRLTLTRSDNGAFYAYWWNPGDDYVPTLFALVDPSNLKSQVQWRLFALYSYAATTPGVIAASNYQPIVFAKGYDASTPAAHDIFIPCSRSGDTFWSDIGGTDPADGKYDALPAHIFCIDSLLRGYRGKVPDVYLPQAGATTGDVTPSAGDPERTLLNGYWIPCGVAPDFGV